MNVPDLSRPRILVRPLTPSASLNDFVDSTLSVSLSLYSRESLSPIPPSSSSCYSPASSMGLLDQLWDDTVAGPRPENGLGKLRKNQTFGARSSSGKGVDGGSARSYGEGSTEEATRVTRSIMIVKPPGYGSGVSDSTPASPAGSTPPVSPFSGSLSVFEEDQHRMPMRRQAKSLEQRAPLLLTMCDM